MRQKCLIINFPGSKKAVGECLEVVIDSIPHALELLKNNMSSVTASHNILRAPVKSKVIRINCIFYFCYKSQNKTMK